MPNQVQTGNAIVLIGDEIAPTSHLRAIVDVIRAENERLPEESQIHFVVCPDPAELALSLKKQKELIKLVLVGPGFDGKADMIARFLGGCVQTIVVLDPSRRALAEDRDTAKRLLENLTEIGTIVTLAENATPELYRPIVQDVVLSGVIRPSLDLAALSPRERAELLERRLESVTMFPSLPETQARIDTLDDMAPPGKWAAAIDPDIPVKTVILRSLNTAHYSFRYPVRTIEQAVSLASARKIRELVLACTVRRLFKTVEEARIEQFWKHSVATAFFARVMSLPADPEQQSPRQKGEFDRLGLRAEQRGLLAQLELWKRFDLDDDLDPFTAGLLHDIGKITLALCFEGALQFIDPIVEAAVAEADAAGELWADPIRKIERALMGDLDHEVIGSRLAKRWNLDLRLQEVIGHHHRIRRKSPGLLALVSLADLAANTLHAYPVREEHHPLCRLFRRIRRASSSYEGDEAREVAVDALRDDLSGELEKVTRSWEVPDHLWQILDRPTFFALCYLLGPAVRRSTAAFLQMTASAV